MRAIVCDCCGKVMLLEDEKEVADKCWLQGPNELLCMDLCEECARSIVNVVREQKDRG